MTEAHHPCRMRQEVAAVLEAQLAGALQPQPAFVHQGPGVGHRHALAAPQPGARHRGQVVVEHRKQAVEGLGVAGPGGGEQGGDFGHLRNLPTDAGTCPMAAVANWAYGPANPWCGCRWRRKTPAFAGLQRPLWDGHVRLVNRSCVNGDRDPRSARPVSRLCRLSRVWAVPATFVHIHARRDSMFISMSSTAGCKAHAASDSTRLPAVRHRRTPLHSALFTTTMLAALVALALPRAASAANLFADYSPNTNPNGAWTYGYAASPGASFAPYTFAAASNLDGVHVGIQGWAFAEATTPLLGVNISGALIDDGNVSLPTGVVLMHGRGTSLEASVVRWAASEAGAYQVTATFTGYQRNMQASVAVFNGDSSIFGTSIGGLGGSASFTGVVNVVAGGTLSFAVNRNAPDQNGFAGNWTGLDLTITPVPEPGTWALLLAGLVATATAARRRSA